MAVARSATTATTSASSPRLRALPPRSSSPSPQSRARPGTGGLLPSVANTRRCARRCHGGRSSSFATLTPHPAERKGKKWMMRLRSEWSTCTFLLDHVAHEEGGATNAMEKGLYAADVQDIKKEEVVTLSKKQKTSLILLRCFPSSTTRICHHVDSIEYLSYGYVKVFLSHMCFVGYFSCQVWMVMPLIPCCSETSSPIGPTKAALPPPAHICLWKQTLHTQELFSEPAAPVLWCLLATLARG